MVGNLTVESVVLLSRGDHPDETVGEFGLSNGAVIRAGGAWVTLVEVGGRACLNFTAGAKIATFFSKVDRGIGLGDAETVRIESDGWWYVL